MAHPTESPAAAADAKPPASSGGGIKAWLPLILSLVLLPGLAYAMTMFVILPKLQKGLHAQARGGEGGGGSEAGGEAGTSAEGHGGQGGSAAANGKPKVKVPLSKIIVNVSGSSGSRLLLTSLTLAGSASDFKSRLDDNMDQLRDIASSTLASKTITDLERPESRNQIRSELLSQFNATLGNGFVQEIYITELAIQ